jgi:hypothetical protein
MLFFNVIVLATAALLRSPARELRAPAQGFGLIQVFADLASVLRSKGAAGCASYVDGTLKDLAKAYTAVQVPHVLTSVCNSGTFFHSFPTKSDCQNMTDDLVKEFDGGKNYTSWCSEVQVLIGDDEATEEKEEEPEGCKCVGMPSSLQQNDTARKGYSADYGAECAAHDLTTDACAGEFKPAYCHQEWCYVNSACNAKDKKETFFFPAADLQYSYQHCGGLDAYAAEACAKHEDESSCTSFSSNCAFNTKTNLCQNKLCQCTGDNLGLNTTGLGSAEYGETCAAWDKEMCEGWQDRGDAFDLGLWCCKSWCYVEPSCPSAEQSALKEGLAFSYLTCPDKTEDVAQCPWKDQVDFAGRIVPISAKVADSLNNVTL